LIVIPYLHSALNTLDYPKETMTDIIIYHNPRCSKSRETLELILQRGEKPTIIEYLKTPPDRLTLEKLLRDARLEARDLLRSNEDVYQKLDLGNPDLSDEKLLDAMESHPELINRPIVITPRGTRLCRPPEKVLDLL
jgi:arsenate reductase (glutaredoxin)